MAEPAAVPGVDPSRVNTPGELAACLDGLRRRRGLSYEVMEKAAAQAAVPIGRVAAGAAAQEHGGRDRYRQAAARQGQAAHVPCRVRGRPGRPGSVAGCLGAGQYR